MYETFLIAEPFTYVYNYLILLCSISLEIGVKTMSTSASCREY